MGVKSTRHLTRERAEEMYVDMWFEKNRRKIHLLAFALENEELENILEEWNDELHDGDGFENYIISE